MIYKITPSDAGTRLDAYLAATAELSRSAVAHLIEAGEVTVGGAPVTKNYRLRAGDAVALTPPPPVELSVEPEDIPLDIVYEDDDLLVVNKPAGMVVHPAPGNYSGTLVSALLYHCKGRLSGINGVLRPGIVHRIDKETAGLLVVAKTDAAHRRLAADLETHAIRREYRAVVRGNPKDDVGIIDRPIGRHPVDRKKMAVVADGRHAVTHYTVLERFRGAAYLHLSLETGRTHQIRVHMA
ncbi:MAG: RluA family pseudouridine synthase, partial [Clostridia bacterium]|nr:RluA family pseudouridine synthase [Clostridia bacterium]